MSEFDYNEADVVVDDTPAEAPAPISEQQLFERLTYLEEQKLTLADDIKQLKADAKFDEDSNPKGLDREAIKLISAAAKLEAKNNFEEISAAQAAVAAKYKELVGYDD